MEPHPNQTKPNQAEPSQALVEIQSLRLRGASAIVFWMESPGGTGSLPCNASFVQIACHTIKYCKWCHGKENAKPFACSFLETFPFIIDQLPLLQILKKTLRLYVLVVAFPIQRSLSWPQIKLIPFQLTYFLPFTKPIRPMFSFLWDCGQSLIF